MDTTENTLRAVLKALDDVIAPAIDPSDGVAREQLRLVTDYIRFVQLRLDHLGDRERFELRHHLGLGRQLQALAAPASESVRHALDEAIATGAGLLAGTHSMADLRAANAALAGAARRLVREAAGYPAGPRRAIEMTVLDASDARIDFERSWYLPLGFDPAPAEARPLADHFAEG